MNLTCLWPRQHTPVCGQPSRSSSRHPVGARQHAGNPQRWDTDICFPPVLASELFMSDKLQPIVLSIIVILQNWVRCWICIVPKLLQQRCRNVAEMLGVVYRHKQKDEWWWYHAYVMWLVPWQPTNKQKLLIVWLTLMSYSRLSLVIWMIWNRFKITSEIYWDTSLCFSMVLFGIRISIKLLAVFGRLDKRFRLVFNGMHILGPRTL